MLNNKWQWVKSELKKSYMLMNNVMLTINERDDIKILGIY